MQIWSLKAHKGLDSRPGLRRNVSELEEKSVEITHFEDAGRKEEKIKNKRKGFRDAWNGMNSLRDVMLVRQKEKRENKGDITILKYIFRRYG